MVVIGSGAGAEIAQNALSKGLSVALVDRGAIGGTCLNVGCIPTKMLVFPADRIVEIEDTKKLGITAEIKDIDFKAIMDRMQRLVDDDESNMREGLKSIKGLELYESEAHFVSDYTLEVGGVKIRGEKIFIATGARPLVPKIKGLDKVNFLTNESALRLESRPKSMIIIGGGYVATEFAHFFAAMGTDVTILQRGSRLVPGEEAEVSELLKTSMSRRMKIHTGTEAVEVREKDGVLTVVGVDKNTGQSVEFSAEKILVAAGRTSNADLLKVENTGVKTDQRGYIVVNEFLETTKEGIWAIGDAIGKAMFRHAANEEAEIAWHNSGTGEHKVEMDYSATPHAVFTSPQIASVGLREAEARKSRGEILVGKAMYSEVAKGAAMMEDAAFAKAIVDKESLQILGFHIIGPYAAILLQEVVNAMANKLDIYSIGRAMHIHPALSELIVATLGNLAETS